MYLYIYVFIYLFIYVFIYLCVYLFIYVFTLFIYIDSYCVGCFASPSITVIKKDQLTLPY